MKKTTLKKITAFVCALSLCFSMAGCADSSKEDKDSSSKPTSSVSDTSSTVSSVPETTSETLSETVTSEETTTTTPKKPAVEYKQKPLSNNFYDYQFQVDGDVITLPIKIAEIEALGYEVELRKNLSIGHARKGTVSFVVETRGDYIYELDLSGPDNKGLKGHEIKISGGFTLYKDDYNKILEKLGNPTGTYYGDEYTQPGIGFIRLYNNGDNINELASVFMNREGALPAELRKTEKLMGYNK